MARANAPQTPLPYSTARLAAFFALFSFAPGLLYQYVEDHWRDLAAGAPGLLRLALDVAPNALGALASAAAIFLIGLGLARARSPRFVAFLSAGVASGGLIAWEVAQIAIPGATFDANDIVWTLAGAAAFLIAAWAFFPLGSRASDRASLAETR